jgi:hypothetical protein
LHLRWDGSNSRGCYSSRAFKVRWVGRAGLTSVVCFPACFSCQRQAATLPLVECQSHGTLFNQWFVGTYPHRNSDWPEEGLTAAWWLHAVWWLHAIRLDKTGSTGLAIQKLTTFAMEALEGRGAFSTCNGRIYNGVLDE